MTTFASVRSALQKRAAYRQTRFEISQLPVELAVEDLGLLPADADAIARRAVYG